jgi:hypothetical protein
MFLIDMLIRWLSIVYSLTKNGGDISILSSNMIDQLFGNEKDKPRESLRRPEISINIRKLAPYNQNPRRRRVLALCGWSIERDLESTIAR